MKKEESKNKKIEDQFFDELTYKQQVEKLADWILKNMPEGIKEGEVTDIAIKIMRKYKSSRHKKKEAILREYWDDFLNEYYHQKCDGCPEGHNSFWKTIVESKEWQDWKKYNFKISPHGNWDFPENEELGILGEKHWKAFVKFIKSHKD